MHPTTRKLLLTTTSAAALAIAGTAMFAGTDAQGATTVSAFQNTAVTTGFDLTVTGSGQLIVDTARAVQFDGDNQQITNAGQIIGTGVGGGGVLTNAKNGFTITNNNLIETDTTGTKAAIEVDGGNSGTTATITNNGTITNINAGGGGADRAAILISGATKLDITNNATGVISGVSAAGIHVNNAVTGTITNAGQIMTGNQGGYPYGAIFIDVGASGSVVNQTTGVIQGDKGGDAISLFGNASVDNSGTIQQINGGASARGIGIGGGVAANIVNQSGGTISSTGTGTGGGAIFLGGKLTGSITNSGMIVSKGSDASAINLFGGAEITGTVTNNSGGNIEAPSGNSAFAINLAAGATKITGGIINTGTIKSTGDTGGAIHLGNKATANITNNNGGLITASSSYFLAAAIRIGGGTTTITNDGTISTTNSDSVAAIWVDNTAAASTVTIHNVGPGTGVIDGNGTYAIHYDSNVTGDIVNDVGATIKNQSAAATVIMDSIKLTGKIDNSGTIVNSGSGVAVDLFGSQVTGGLINRAGGVIQASGTNAVSLSHNTFTIEGGQVIGNTVGASTSTVNFNLASVTPATFNPFVNSFGFNTDGNFTLVTTGTSAINVNTGALLVDFNNNLQADSITVGSNGVLD
mgnify:CR=1 FL=1